MKNLMIGLDPGVKTGFAIWDCEKQCFDKIETCSIISAMQKIRWSINDVKMVIFEDARQRKWFGKTSREVLQGAGSIKRDCNIWEEFLVYYKIDFRTVAPKDNKTKTKADYFKRLTGWKNRTSEHSRDAAMLVFGMK